LAFWCFPGRTATMTRIMWSPRFAHQPVTYLWHASEDLQGCDAILIPGGFAYGDYLRTGAIARFAPGDAVGQTIRQGWRTGDGNLQWLSDSVRSRSAAGSADAQCQPALHLQADILKTETVIRPFTNGLLKPDRSSRCRLDIWKATTSATQRRWRSIEGRRKNRLSLLDARGYRDRGGKSEWLARKYRRRLK
jgi:hypothetical protein